MMGCHKEKEKRFHDRTHHIDARNWKKKAEKEGKEQKKKQKKIQNEKTYHGNISFENMPKVQNLKPSQLGTQGSVFDDTGGVEMFSPRSIVLGGRDWKRLHKKENIARGYFI